jgi:hypothetical protein
MRWATISRARQPAGMRASSHPHRAVACAVLLLLVAPPAAAPAPPGKRAFYALFEPMLRAPGEWPSRYEQFRDGVVVLDPFNATRATVAEVKRALNATVLMYWDTNDMIVNHTGECLRKKGTGQVEGECGGLDGAGEPKPCSTGHYMCCDRFDCPYSKAPMCGPDAFPDAFAKVFDPTWAVRELPGPCVNASCPVHQPHAYWGAPGQTEGGTYCCPTPVAHGGDCGSPTCRNGSTSTDCACCLATGSKTGCEGAPKCSGAPDAPPGTKICDDGNTAPMPQCLYFFGLSFVPFKKAVTAIGNFLADWVKDKGYDGLYLECVSQHLRTHDFETRVELTQFLLISVSTSPQLSSTGYSSRLLGSTRI